MYEPKNEFTFQDDENLFYGVTGFGFNQLEFLEQSSLMFQVCASQYFDWNHLPSGPYWVRTKNVIVNGVIDKVLAVYRSNTFVEVKFAITLPHFEIDYPHSHPKNPNIKLKTFNLVLQISGKSPRKTMDESAVFKKTEVALYIKTTTDPVFDDDTSDLYCIDTLIQLPNGRIIGDLDPKDLE